MSERTDTQHATDSARASDALERVQPQLFLVLERARPLAGGARHSLANIDQVRFGRGTARSARRFVEGGQRVLELRVPDARMSVAHARLDRDHDQWTLSDCESTNGILANGQRVERMVLSEGDVFELGRTLLRFRRAMVTPANAPGDVDSGETDGVSRWLATISPPVVRDLERLGRIARSDVSLLLEGETGTGKEVLARAIHAESRRTGPFVAVNCGALPQGLVESLLFGHKRGAFSGASSDELGFARAAHKGTLFLDEVGDLPAGSQAILLRLLQEREVVPLGATRPVALDLRVVAATHRSLSALTRSGAFRQDLLARLAQFTYSLPPLRERIDDIGTLVAAILPKVAGARAASLSLTASATRELLAYGWPTNVRELEHRLKMGVILTTADRIDLGPAAFEPPREPTPSPSPKARRLSPEDESLRQRLHAQMAEHRGNLTQVARAMETTRRQVQRWVSRFAIDPAHYRA